MSTIILFAIAFLLLVTSFAAKPVFGYLTARKKYQLACITEFFDHAPDLIASKELPLPLARLLAELSEDIDSARAVRAMLRVWLAGGINPESRATGQKKFVETMNNLPDHLRAEFTMAVAMGLVGMTFSTLISGTILRRLLFRTVGMPQRSDDAPLFAYGTVGSHCLT